MNLRKIVLITTSLGLLYATQLMAMPQPKPQKTFEELVTDFKQAVSMFIQYIDQDWIPEIIAGKASMLPTEFSVELFNGKKVSQRGLDRLAASLKGAVRASSDVASKRLLKEQLTAYDAKLALLNDTVTILIERTSPTLYQDLQKKYASNFDQFKGKVAIKQLYQLIGFGNNAAGIAASQANIKPALAKAHIDGIDDAALRRQLTYIFDNQYSRQLYNAFIQGESAVNRLKLSAQATNPLVNLSLLIATLKNAVAEIVRLL